MNSLRTLLLSLLNSYHVLLVVYWVLRGLFGGAWWWLALLNTFALLLALPLLLTLPLSLLLRGKRTSAFALLLTLIAAIKFAPLPKCRAPHAKQTIRVMTFNLWNRNPQLNNDVDWMLAQDVDVLILQEVVPHHLPTLSRLITHYPYSSRTDGRVLLISRYPLCESQSVVLEAATREHKGRLAVRAVLDVFGKSVTVFGVHLMLPHRKQPRFPLPFYHRFTHLVQHYDEARRNRQIVRLLAMIEREANPVIVAGDFNMSHTSTIYDTIRHAGLVDAYRAAGVGWGLSWPVHLPLPALLRIDYVWHTPDLRTLRAQQSLRRGSDHLPLSVDIAIE